MIYDITPFTTLDYPNKLACIIWCAGCNMRCLYCYNEDIIKGKANITYEELEYFLNTRKNLLDGVVFSGGECTLSPNLISYIKLAKALGFYVKIDTNGSNPEVLKNLLNLNLIDYVALDFKALNYKKICGKDFYNEFLKSLKLLNDNDKIDFEVRTTWHFDLLSVEDILKMNAILRQNGYKNKYYLQKFLEVPNLSNLKQSNALINMEYFDDSFVFRNFV